MATMGLDHVQDLVEGLNDLQRNHQTQAELIMLGEQAVEPLVKFLLGPPAQFPQPRCLAAEALGIIGGEAAFDGLIRALSVNDVGHSDPLLQLSEEMVRNSACEQLATFRDHRAVQPLLDALIRHHLVGAALTLAGLHEARAIPAIVESLEDPFIRERMAEALLGFGLAAVPPLVQTLSMRRDLCESEARPSIERRALAARLLGRLHATEATEALLAAVKDECEEVRLQAALAIFKLVEDHRIDALLPHLIGALKSKDLLLEDEGVEAFVRVGARAVPFLMESLKNRAAETGRVRLLLIEALGRIGDRRACSILEAMQADSDPRIQRKAEKILRLWGVPRSQSGTDAE